MKLSDLYEAKVHTYKQKNIKKQVSDTVPSSTNGSWYNKKSAYADNYSMTKSGKDSKLLPQYRGKGLA